MWFVACTIETKAYGGGVNFFPKWSFLIISGYALVVSIGTMRTLIKAKLDPRALWKFFPYTLIMFFVSCLLGIAVSHLIAD